MPALLAALLAITLASCSGDGGPTFVDSAARFCGVEVTAFNRGETEPSARQCFLDAHNAGETAQLFLVEIRSGTVWTTQAGQVRALNASQDHQDSPSQVEWSCTTLEPTHDELVFRPISCTDPVAVPAPPGDVVPEDGSVLLCGAEAIVHSLRHRNEGARRCLHEAFEAGNPARLFSAQTTVEGDPVVKIYTVAADGVIEVFVDSRDNFGDSGLFTYRCATLASQEAPSVWSTADCSEWEEF